MKLKLISALFAVIVWFPVIIHAQIDINPDFTLNCPEEQFRAGENFPLLSR